MWVGHHYSCCLVGEIIFLGDEYKDITLISEKMLDNWIGKNKYKIVDTQIKTVLRIQNRNKYKIGINNITIINDIQGLI